MVGKNYFGHVQTFALLIHISRPVKHHIPALLISSICIGPAFITYLKRVVNGQHTFDTIRVFLSFLQLLDISSRSATYEGRGVCGGGQQTPAEVRI